MNGSKHQVTLDEGHNRDFLFIWGAMAADSR